RRGGVRDVDHGEVGAVLLSALFLARDVEEVVLLGGRRAAFAAEVEVARVRERAHRELLEPLRRLALRPRQRARRRRLRRVDEVEDPARRGDGDHAPRLAPALALRARPRPLPPRDDRAGLVARLAALALER